MRGRESGERISVNILYKRWTTCARTQETWVPFTLAATGPLRVTSSSITIGMTSQVYSFIIFIFFNFFKYFIYMFISFLPFVNRSRQTRSQCGVLR